MKLKANCKHLSEDQAMSDATLICYHVFSKHGYAFVKTAITDGLHSQQSLHPKKRAFDFRTNHIASQAEKNIIIKEIQEALTDEYDVILEGAGTPNEHGHLEWDVD